MATFNVILFRVWFFSLIICTVVCGGRSSEHGETQKDEDRICSGAICEDDDILPHVTYPDDVVKLTTELIAIPSPSGSESEAGRYIEEWLNRRGWNVSIQVVHTSGADQRFNVVAIAPGIRLENVDVIMSSHFDTVPVVLDTPRISATHLYGRGAVDAKGIVASLLVAGEALKRRGITSIALLLVCGEETDHAGMLAANNLGFRESVVLLNGEPTIGRLCVQQKGMLKIQLSARGVACHSGYPELGSSAIDSLMDVLGRLRSHEWPKDPSSNARTTVNIGLIRGGTAANILAPSASATLLFRLISDPKDVLASVRSIVASNENVSVSVITQNPPQHIYAPPRAAERFGTYVASYNTDLSYFFNAGKRVLFGGGTILNAHVDDELIALQDLIAMPGQYEVIVEELVSEMTS